MNSPVPIVERMDVDKAKSQRCGSDDSVRHFRCTMIEREHSLHKGRQVFRTSADVIGDWCVGLAIMCAYKTTLAAQAEVYEPLITDDNPLEPQQLIEIE